MKYTIDGIPRELYAIAPTDLSLAGHDRFNASRKPKTDSVKTLASLGATVIEIDESSGGSRLERLFHHAFQRVAAKLRCRDVRGGVVFLQYLFFAASVSMPLLRFLKKRDNLIITLFHDMDSSRGQTSRKQVRMERQALEESTYAIIPTPEMAGRLAALGIRLPKHSILGFFDYLTEDTAAPPADLRDVRLIFAGNFKKAGFLARLKDLPLSDSFQIFLYGSRIDGIDRICANESIKYKGTFEADRVSGIEGNWGLVWDGDEIDTCSGAYGDYLRMNTPFKFSTYLAAGRPVVVWSQSAMARHVRERHLGICVDSLHEIPDRVAALSDEELREIAQGVQAASAEVRSAHKLSAALSEFLQPRPNDVVEALGDILP